MTIKSVTLPQAAQPRCLGTWELTHEAQPGHEDVDANGTSVIVITAVTMTDHNDESLITAFVNGWPSFCLKYADWHFSAQGRCWQALTWLPVTQSCAHMHVVPCEQLEVLVEGMAREAGWKQ